MKSLEEEIKRIEKEIEKNKKNQNTNVGDSDDVGGHGMVKQRSDERDR